MMRMLVNVVVEPGPFRRDAMKRFETRDSKPAIRLDGLDRTAASGTEAPDITNHRPLFIGTSIGNDPLILCQNPKGLRGSLTVFLTGCSGLS